MKITRFNLKAQLCTILLIGFCYGQLFELTHDNHPRIYWVDYPDDSTAPVPLVISMHGRFQSLIGAGTARRTGCPRTSSPSRRHR